MQTQPNANCCIISRVALISGIDLSPRSRAGTDPTRSFSMAGWHCFQVKTNDRPTTIIHSHNCRCHLFTCIDFVLCAATFAFSRRRFPVRKTRCYPLPLRLSLLLSRTHLCILLNFKLLLNGHGRRVALYSMKPIPASTQTLSLFCAKQEEEKTTRRKLQ